MKDKKDIGSYVWRGGKTIDLEKVHSRFTIINPTQNELKLINKFESKATPVTKEVYKVDTLSSEKRDILMNKIRTDYNKICHHCYKPKDSEGTMYYITDSIIVRFKHNIQRHKIEDLIAKYNLDIFKEYTNPPNNTFLLRITNDSKENPIKIANRLKEYEKDTVESAEPNMINRFNFAGTKNKKQDVFFKFQWYLDSATNESEGLLTNEINPSINAKEAWKITKGKKDIVLAIIDDGFDLSHPDFLNEERIVFPKDFVDGDTNPFPVTNEIHGTAVAGIALAEHNERGIMGIAPECSFMPVRVSMKELYDGSLKDIFNYVSSKADVISCSWSTPPVYAPLSDDLYETITYITTSGGRRGKGCVICFASGNFNAPIKDENSKEFIWCEPNYNKLTKTIGPIDGGFANHPNIITVSASTSFNKHAAFSNWGKNISVCAPSNNFDPRNPSVSLPGKKIWTIDNEPFGMGYTPNSRYTDNFGGTSCSTPVVAAVAALILSVNDNLSALEVKEILESTADKIQDNSPDLLGYNRGHYDNKDSEHSEWFGYGKVNAAKAVKLGLDRKKKKKYKIENNIR